MGVSISYMGTKRELAPAVSEVIKHAQDGIMLDAFSGMCSVGEEVAPSRQIWSNDVQVFASEIAKALFTSEHPPATAMNAADQHFDIFEAHYVKLAKNRQASIAAEDELLQSGDFEIFLRRADTLSSKLASEVTENKSPHYQLFTTLYSNNYFGVRQAIEADAIIKAIYYSHERGRISTDEKRWMMIALGRALLKIANSTGHFAQFLKPKQTSYKRLIAQRRRRLWAEWLFSVGELAVIGSSEWRKLNKAFNQDSLALLPTMANAKERPSVIYADPPYTDDQYSRYYHILETLMLYDYPNTSGAGLYRIKRFSTPFSIKSRSAQAFEDLVRLSSLTGADLVLSYPTNGLIHDVGATPLGLLRKYYRRVECSYEVACEHSTFGASKGTAQTTVIEHVYLAKS